MFWLLLLFVGWVVRRGVGLGIGGVMFVKFVLVILCLVEILFFVLVILDGVGFVGKGVSVDVLCVVSMIVLVWMGVGLVRGGVVGVNVLMGVGDVLLIVMGVVMLIIGKSVGELIGNVLLGLVMICCFGLMSLMVGVVIVVVFVIVGGVIVIVVVFSIIVSEFVNLLGVLVF